MKQNEKFDERQLMERGKVFMQAFLMLALLVLADSIVKTFVTVWADSLSSTLIIIMSVTCYASIRLILRDSYNGMGKWNLFVILFTIAPVISLSINMPKLLSSSCTITINGQITSTAASIIVSSLVLTIAIVYWIKNHMDRKAEKLTDKVSE